MLSMFLLAVPFLVLLVWLIVRFGTRPSAAQRPALVLAPTGRRTPATFARVGQPQMLGRYGHGESFHSVPVAFTTPAGETIETHLTCSSQQLHLVQPGAPCELLIDPANPARLMVSSVKNSFGAIVQTEIGSSHFPW